MIKENKLNKKETIEVCRTLNQLLCKSAYNDCKLIKISEQYILFGENLLFQSISKLCPSIWEKPYNEGNDHQISNLEEAINRDIFRSYCQKCQQELIYC